MLLDLSKVRTAREHYQKVYEPEAFSGDPGAFRVVAPVALDLDIFKDKQRFRLIGAVKTTLELSCGRCLEGFPWSVDAPFDLRYQQDASGAGGEERQIEEDDLSTASYENNEIDLAQLMQEQFYLSLPMKPLCRVDCRGLCPVCGTNLNRDTCQCRRVWEDPRFSALKALKSDS